MKFLSADFVFSAHTGFIRNGVLALRDDGAVEALLDPSKEEVPAAEQFDGVLCPGFVNAHCHLELSHLRGQITKHTGFVGFAKELLPKRGTFSPEQIAGAIVKAEEEMYCNGIVAVGDIANTADTFPQKTKGRLQYHTFIELLALNPAMAEEVFAAGKELLSKAPQPASLAPHAPYSVSHRLMEKIAAANAARHTVASYHSQESPAEEEFSIKGTGPMTDFYRFLGIGISFYRPYGENSLRASLPHLLQHPKLLLVHNTLASADDIRWAETQHRGLYWCFCPNANRYIENRLPDFLQFHNAGVRIVVGTDSLASNDGLSILDELKVIAENSPAIPAADLLTWATKNGAEALQFGSLGTFEEGKTPGVIRLSGYNGKTFDWRSAAVSRIC